MNAELSVQVVTILIISAMLGYRYNHLCYKSGITFI